MSTKGSARTLQIIGGGVGLFALAGAAWIWSLPRARPAISPPLIAEEETLAILAALAPPSKRQRPLVTIIGANDGTETVDYLMPYGILQRADIAEVWALATRPGPVSLYPVFKVEPRATIAEFDAQYPEGADYVLVPALRRADDPAVLRWLESQSRKGAIVIGVCAGAKVVANARLLDGKRATTHWYYVKGMLREHPTINYVPDRRLVVDRGVATTTGMSASLPLSLFLIEAIAGREKAAAVARELGLTQWDARHDSHAFKFTRPFAWTVITNRLAFWNHEKFGIELSSGIDEVSLALVADLWSRTYRSRVVTFAATPEARSTRNGSRILPDAVADAWPKPRLLPAIADRKPVEALEEALSSVAARYGLRTLELVAMQLEYPHTLTQRRLRAASDRSS